MEQKQSTPDILEQLMLPAFSVKDGIIIQANQAALQRQIQVGTAVCEIIEIGKEEYADFSSGNLRLTLQICDIPCNASVTARGDLHDFVLETDYEDPALRALALAAQELRGPLSNALSSTASLLPSDTIDAEAQKELGRLNRSLYQLMRAVSNMSDASGYKNRNSYRMESRNIVAVFEEILEKAACLTAQADRTLNYKCPQKDIYGLADAGKLERAVLNLISNAIKYTRKGGHINAQLSCHGDRLSFTVSDSGEGIDRKMHSVLFSRHLRLPGLDSTLSGIGLGMSMVHAIAAAHGGTVLVEQPEGSGARITMTLVLRKSTETEVRSPILLPVDYAGGYDRGLLELSDVLPNALFEKNF